MAKGAELSILNNDPTAALRYIDLFLATYPDDPKAGLMQFKKGIVFDLLIRDGLRAVAEYDIFLKKYPNDPLRQDAINAILLIQNPETFMATITSEQDSISKADSTKGLQ
jgi:outer membrane protein assembly factor BamD (BamD/ComL family)